MLNKQSVKYLFCKLYLIITRLIISLTKTRDFHIGTRVLYSNREYVVESSNYVVKGERVCKIKDPKYKIKMYVRPCEIKKVADLDNLIHDAFAWWKWYEQSWLELDTRSMERYNQLRSVRIVGKKTMGKRYRFK